MLYMHMDELIWQGRNKEMAIEIALECEHFLAIPMVVKQTWIDRLLFRWRIVADSQHLSDGFAWEAEP